ncbi:hypothetical protein GQ55_4G059900 [Panicum hallii var. hallii]|uniref:Uncharacterized protein n=1 Tax=Panicum hallii var. hallii TaxID=1504633 RepID=A0A2T7DVS2_9POAL|nr:hypothetical protein GQ55_4G059900 [Panicum hallii var. hallii]
MAGSHERGPTSWSELPADMLGHGPRGTRRVAVRDLCRTGGGSSSSEPGAAMVYSITDGRSYPVPRSTAPPSPGGSGRASPTAGLDARVLADYLYHRVHLVGPIGRRRLRRRAPLLAAGRRATSSTSRGRATRTGLG